MSFDSWWSSVGFCRGSRVEGKMSSVEGKMLRVEGKMSRVICFVNISRLALPARFPANCNDTEWREEEEKYNPGIPVTY